MNKDASGSVALVCAHKIWNVPPLLNAPKVFAQKGWDATVFGYHSDELPGEESLGELARIRRLQLKSRRIPFGPLRKVSSTIEFLAEARGAVSNLRPDLLICVNEPASILLRHAEREVLKVAWPLEYPEFEMFKPAERLLWRYSSASWSKADFLVAPTATRLALSCGLHPALLRKKSFVVHNVPLREDPASTASSPKAKQALTWMLSERKAGRVVLVYAGAIGNRYGVNRLIEAVSSVPAVSLLILGQRHELAEREVGEALQGVRDASRICWVDEISYHELPAVLVGADAGFVHYVGDTINTRFSAPGKLYEYLRSGLAIVTDDECCIKQELDANGAGVFFRRPGTREGIVSALRELSASRDRLTGAKVSARNMFENEFNLQHQMAPLLDAAAEYLVQ